MTFFKPRIFISSTLRENLNIRKKIESFYKSVGAEAILYERNLTPSTNTMTFRTDILYVDFIIFIIKNEYGEKTKMGISGTHEEFRIALDNNIPFHVYVKFDEGKDDIEGFKKEIEDSEISYYYFNNDNELFERIKETTFTIAKEITLRKVEDAKLSKVSVKRISVKYDYEQAIQIIKIIEEMMALSDNYDWVCSSLFSSFMDYIEINKSIQKWIFVDNKLEDIFTEMIMIYKKYDTHPIDYTSKGVGRTYNSKVLGKVLINELYAVDKPKLTPDQYREIVIEFLNKYNEFKDYIERMRVFADIIE